MSWGELGLSPTGRLMPGAAPVTAPEPLLPIGGAKSLISVIYSSCYKCARPAAEGLFAPSRRRKVAGPRGSCFTWGGGTRPPPAHTLVRELGALRGERGVQLDPPHSLRLALGPFSFGKQRSTRDADGSRAAVCGTGI